MAENIFLCSVVRLQIKKLDKKMDIDKIEQRKRFSHVGIHSNTNDTYTMQYKEAFDTLYESSKLLIQ